MSEIQRLPLDQIQPGAVLAEAVADARGTVLLPAGLSLTETHLSSLRRRSISTLTVAAPPDPAELARRREKIRERVLFLFRHSADDPAAQGLQQAVLAFRQEQLQ
jgi:hypothetical protein